MWGTVTGNHTGHQKSAGVTPEVNLREHTSHMLPSSTNKAAYSDFETQKSKTGVSVYPQKDMCPPKFYLNKNAFQ